VSRRRFPASAIRRAFLPLVPPCHRTPDHLDTLVRRQLASILILFLADAAPPRLHRARQRDERCARHVTARDSPRRSATG